MLDGQRSLRARYDALAAAHDEERGAFASLQTVSVATCNVQRRGVPAIALVSPDPVRFIHAYCRDRWRRLSRLPFLPPAARRRPPGRLPRPPLARPAPQRRAAAGRSPLRVPPG